MVEVRSLMLSQGSSVCIFLLTERLDFINLIHLVGVGLTEIVALVSYT